MIISTGQREAGSIHFAKLDKSPRLQQLLTFLRARGERGATTSDILNGCPLVKAVSAAACELDRNGYAIECKAEGFTGDGGRVYRYTLKDSAHLAPTDDRVNGGDSGTADDVDTASTGSGREGATFTRKPWRERFAEAAR